MKQRRIETQPVQVPNTVIEQTIQCRRMNATQRAQDCLHRYVPAYRVSVEASRLSFDELLRQMEK